MEEKYIVNLDLKSKNRLEKIAKLYNMNEGDALAFLLAAGEKSEGKGIQVPNSDIVYKPRLVIPI